MKTYVSWDMMFFHLTNNYWHQKNLLSSSSGLSWSKRVGASDQRGMLCIAKKSCKPVNVVLLMWLSKPQVEQNLKDVQQYRNAVMEFRM